jgi:hypothetical protein
MAKKKKNQTQEGLEAPINQTVFSEVGAAQGAAAANQTANQTVDQIPGDVAELITATLKVLIARRKVLGLSTTLSSLAKAVVKNLEPYLDNISMKALRDFIRAEVEKMGYRVIEARVNYSGVPYIAETVLLYKSFDEIIDVIKGGRIDSFKAVISTEGIDPIFDRLANA